MRRAACCFWGGHGVSDTPFANNPPTTFANNEGWYDDTSDGPVNAHVVYQGQTLPVLGAWVVCTPPNYVPDIISVQTMYDVITDALQKYYLTPKIQPSFQVDIYPLLAQFSQSQLVNQFFYVAYGQGQPYNFADPELLRKLSTLTTDSAGVVTDDYREYRRQIFNYFRSPTSTQVEPQRWPWMYGDNMNVPATTANGYLSVTHTLYGYLNQWVQGDFVPGWEPTPAEPAKVEAIANPQSQADTLTKAALWYCLGGLFHPGCELTWPMRQSGMYTGPYRIRQRSPNNPAPDYGPLLLPGLFVDSASPTGIFWNGPGDLTRWMACPWQTDTASCRAGYENLYDPLVPTFWPARVPYTVLTEHDYGIVMDEQRSLNERRDAFNRRASWYRILGANYLDNIQCMVERYGDLGVVEYRPGLPGSADFPAAMYVETKPYAPVIPAGHAERRAPGEADPATAARTLLVELAEALPYVLVLTQIFLKRFG